MTMWTISLPLSVPVSSKKIFVLNLNKYRGCNTHVLNKAKEAFTRIVRPLLRGIPELDQYTLEYVYHPGAGRTSDTCNVCTVVDKFFADTLVECGVIRNDSRKYHRGTSFLPGKVDKLRPRVDVTIRSAHVLPERKNRMKARAVFTIEPHEVQEALHAYFIRKNPGANPSEKLDFKPVADGSFETQATLDLSKAVSGSTVAREPAPASASPTVPLATRPEPRTEPQAAPSAAAKATPAPTHTLPEMQPVAPPAAPKPAEEKKATADLPPEPPKKAGLFDDFDETL